MLGPKTAKNVTQKVTTFVTNVQRNLTFAYLVLINYINVFKYSILFLEALTKQKPISHNLNVQSHKYARTDTRAAIEERKICRRSAGTGVV